MNRVLLRDRAAGWLLALAYAALLLVAQRDTGFARDEGVYFRAARPYAAWWAKLAESPREALRKPVIDRAFSPNHEHPALMKTLFGASERLFHEKLGWLPRSAALRLPGIVFSAAALAILYSLGVAWHSRTAGLAAALLYAALPRLFFHAQLATFDAPVATMVLAVTAAFARALTSRISAVWCGVLFGLALATKLNAFFVPPVLAAWLLLARRDRLRAGAFALACMAILGPLVFFAHWPWLWTDTLRRVAGYVGFHSRHSYYNTEYFGENYNRPPLPMAYPFVMTAFTTPVVTMALSTAGVVLGLARRSLRAHAALWLLSLIVPIAIIAHPSVPIFGGTKHWLAAMPFFALFAGAALAEAASALGPLARASVLALAVAPGALSLLHAHPFGLSQYNALVGGTPGAADRGLLRQFWGYPTRALLPWMNATFPPRAGVYWHDTNHDSVVAYQREGLLRPDLRDAGMEWAGVRASSRALVIHELHFAKYEHVIWNAYGTATPTRVLALDGVPLVTVYARP
mgnify:CR=1 FL=1